MGCYRSSTKTKTTVVVRDSEEGGFSEMDVVTNDRPGLLTDIVKVLKDINVNVISAEVSAWCRQPAWHRDSAPCLAWCRSCGSSHLNAWAWAPAACIMQG